ncbi:hypothetical protein SAMN04487967_2583 [Natronorubrum sediminis]|uniref:Uncharacterized protein n=1 Tax=Natronorubrum sediminis TaxID=640943 RepID=A0A1H6FZY2_9EURY|nr:hypothetical protein [Natronorubrum sediminis]SEH16376.1 hypothetical protein SAMN04487967_2583 [Natronorubrum sediminis]
MVLTTAFGGVLAAVALFFLWNTWTYVSQYRTISSVDPDATPTMQPGETVTLTGRARVSESAPTPDPRGDAARTDDVDGTDGTADADAGVVAWRIRRRKRKRRGTSSSGSGRRGRRYKWSTERGGLEVGDLEIESEAGTVALDPDATKELMPGGATFGTADPWDSAGLHLGEPDIDTRIDDPRDIGPDLPVDINVGPLSTGERSRFQVSRIDDGDQVIAHGELEMGENGLTLTEGSSASLVLANGSVGDLVGRLRMEIAKNVLFALVLLAFAAATFAGYVDVS